MGFPKGVSIPFGQDRAQDPGREAALPTNMAADSYGQFNASLLYCNKCGQAMPVRQRLLLILPDGELYDYTCERCHSSVGSKTEKAGANQNIGIRKPGLGGS